MTQTRSRLSYFAEQLIVRRGSNGLAYYYELYAPLEDVGELELSPEPFLTVADLQKIFRTYDYRVSPIDLIAATGLPLRVLDREMKHFRKQGIIDILRIARPGDSYRQYVLKEPSINLPESSSEARAIDLEIKEILLDEIYSCRHLPDSRYLGPERKITDRHVQGCYCRNCTRVHCFGMSHSSPGHMAVSEEYQLGYPAHHFRS